jgi:transposase-like protein
MGDISNIRQLVSAARSRILLICPDCGQEHVEFADRLRGSRFYSCTGDGCDYRFDLVAGPRTSYLQRIVAVWRRFYTAFMPAA